MVNLYMRLGSFGGPPPHGSLNIFEPMAVRVKLRSCVLTYLHSCVLVTYNLPFPQWQESDSYSSNEVVSITLTDVYKNRIHFLWDPGELPIGDVLDRDFLVVIDSVDSSHWHPPQSVHPFPFLSPPFLSFPSVPSLSTPFDSRVFLTTEIYPISSSLFPSTNKEVIPSPNTEIIPFPFHQIGLPFFHVLFLSFIRSICFCLYWLLVCMHYAKMVLSFWRSNSVCLQLSLSLSLSGSSFYLSRSLSHISSTHTHTDVNSDICIC